MLGFYLSLEWWRRGNVCHVSELKGDLTMQQFASLWWVFLAGFVVTGIYAIYAGIQAAKQGFNKLKGVMQGPSFDPSATPGLTLGSDFPAGMGSMGMKMPSGPTLADVAEMGAEVASGAKRPILAYLVTVGFGLAFVISLVMNIIIRI